jgi:hypothetical protein
LLITSYLDNIFDFFSAKRNQKRRPAVIAVRFWFCHARIERYESGDLVRRGPSTEGPL